MKGFTLVETLIYLAIVGMVMGSLISFGLSISQAREKTFAQQEVQANMRFVLDIMGRAIRESDGVDEENSIFESDAGRIQLFSAEASKNPIVLLLDTAENTVFIQEGMLVPVRLTSDEVNITRLIFENRTVEGSSKETIGIEIEMGYGNDLLNTRREARTSVNIRR